MSGLFETTTKVAKLITALDNQELANNYIELQNMILEINQQTQQKDEKIKQLEEALAFKNKLVVKDQAYFTVGKDGEIEDGPFCTKCFDRDGKKCRLVIDGNDTRSVKCLHCKLPIHSRASVVFLKR